MLVESWDVSAEAEGPEGRRGGLPCFLCAWRVLGRSGACLGRQMSHGLELGEDYKVAKGLHLEKT